MINAELKQIIVKTWYFLDRGLDVVNQFKYVFAGILALYYMLKFESPVWLPIMFIICVPILIALGWFWTNKMARALEKFGVDRSTFYSKYSYTLQEDRVRSLRKIAGEPYDEETINNLKPKEIQ